MSSWVFENNQKYCFKNNLGLRKKIYAKHWTDQNSNGFLTNRRCKYIPNFKTFKAIYHPCPPQCSTQVKVNLFPLKSQCNLNFINFNLCVKWLKNEITKTFYKSLCLTSSLQSDILPRTPKACWSIGLKACCKYSW